MELPEPRPGMLEAEEVRPAKRQRSYREDELASGLAAEAKALREVADDPSLLSLPDLIIWRIMSFLDATALATMNETCNFFRKSDSHGLSLSNRIAKDRLQRMVGQKLASRWRGYSWLQRLAIEETVTQFDMGQVVNSVGAAEPFSFREMQGVTEIRLEAPGPRMLVSDKSTADSPILRWKLMLRGNNAAEFGVVPLEMQDAHKALHKCQPSPTHNERATGFSSAITVGSLLPARLPVMKGSVVEVLVTPREVAVIVNNPADGAEMVWQNNSTVARSYSGPSELRLALTTNYRSPIKLAITAWQRAAFDVLHTLTPEQQAAHLALPVRPAPPLERPIPLAAGGGAPAIPAAVAAAMQPLVQALAAGQPAAVAAAAAQVQFAAAQPGAAAAAAAPAAQAAGQPPPAAAAQAAQAAAAAAAAPGAGQQPMHAAVVAVPVVLLPVAGVVQVPVGVAGAAQAAEPAPNAQPGMG